MQNYMFAAGVLAILVGLVHSVLGEILIFNRMRNKGVIPTVGAPLLRERHVRILWASWHIVTVFGCAIGAILLRLAFPFSENVLQIFVENTIAISMLVSSLLVLVGTKGMHPGWLALLGVAVLSAIS
jgi:hypothetical protein